MFLTTCPTASARLWHTSFWGRGREVGKDYRASETDGWEEHTSTPLRLSIERGHPGKGVWGGMGGGQLGAH